MRWAKRAKQGWCNSGAYEHYCKTWNINEDKNLEETVVIIRYLLKLKGRRKTLFIYHAKISSVLVENLLLEKEASIEPADFYTNSILSCREENPRNSTQLSSMSFRTHTSWLCGFLLWVVTITIIFRDICSLKEQMKNNYRQLILTSAELG